MAELRLNVIVVDGEAEAKLDKLEAKVQSVTSASDKQAGVVAKVADAYDRVVTKTETVSKSTTTYAEQISKATGETLKAASAAETLGAAKAQQIQQLSAEGEVLVSNTMAWFRANQEQELAKARALETASAQSSLMSAVDLSTTAVIGLGTYLGVATGAGLLWLKFLYDSGAAYLEHTGKLDELKDAISSVKDTWENVKIAVGAILLGNVQDVSSWANTTKELVVTAGSFIVGYVAQQVAAAHALWNAFIGQREGTGELPAAPKAPSLFGGQSASQLGGVNTRGFFRENEVASAFTFGSASTRTSTGRSPAVAQAQSDAAALRESVAAIRADIQAVNYYVENIPRFAALNTPQIPELSYTSGIGGKTLPGTNVGIPQVPQTPAAQSFFNAAFGSQSNFGAMLGSAISGAIQSGSSIWQSIGGTLGQHLGQGLATRLSGFLTSNLGGVIGSAVSALIPGLGALLGPLFGKIGSFFKNLFGGNDTRDLINQTFGSYDNLRSQLNALGAEGERMWIRLTQQTGRNDMQSARQQIDAINQALEAHKQKLNEAGAAAQQAGQQESAAFQHAREQISQLDQQIQSLQQSIANEAPEEVMGIVEAQTRAQIQALQEQRAAAQQQIDQAGREYLQSVNGQDVTINVHWNADPLPNTGTAPSYEPYEAPEPPPMARGGIVRARPGGTIVRVGEAGSDEAIIPLNGSGGGAGTVVLELDGRTIAEVAVPFIPGVVKRYRVGAP